MMPQPQPTTAAEIRTDIWRRLTPFAKPDSRLHLDFAEVIPDFIGSAEAAAHLLAQPVYASAQAIFVTPDNGLVDVRRRLLEAGRALIVSTYGIRRGFMLLDPANIPPGCALYAAWLDGLEHFGRPISLRELCARGPFDAMVTGASAVSRNGVRFGKGHGYFDMEWGMFTDLGLAGEATPVAALVHDVQVVERELRAGPTDILVDAIVTPSGFTPVARGKRPHGIDWGRLDEAQVAAIPPLQELRAWQAAVAAG
jgi:5-formyltetrahydrofolate cyclo-ligase